MSFGRSFKLAAVLLGAFTLMLPSGQAHEDAASTEVLQRLEALEHRLSALEAARSFATFMPDLAERFHVMHRAGDAGDWALAAHELAEIRRLTRQSSDIDPERGKLMQAMMQEEFQRLDEAIEHSNGEKFSSALKSTIGACNGCHVATGVSFVEVTLDASDGLSMRHPHRLIMRDAPEGHHHGSQGGHMMQSTPGSPAARHEHPSGVSDGVDHDAPAHGGMTQH